MKSGLYSRLAWGFGIALVLFHLGTGAFHAHDALVQQAANFTLAQVDRVQLIGQLTAAEPQLLERLSSTSFRISSAVRPPQRPAKAWRHQAEIHRLVAPRLAALGIAPADMRYWFVFGRDGPRLWIALRMDTSQGTAKVSAAGLSGAQAEWLMASVRAEPARWQRHYVGMIWTTAFALLILGLVLWTTRRFTRFLPQLASAAERIGTFGDTQPLPLSGPKEVQKVGAAFNRMQERLREHERERSSMLGAFSHDIRTLVTRITLRLDRLEATEDVAKISTDLAGVTQIVDEALAYSRDEVSDEQKTSVDIASLLQTLVDDTDNAALISPADEPAPVTVVAQPHGLRRAVLNLINNAVLYGQRADVSWDIENDAVVVRVTDQGPGIPAADQQRVLQPYVRLEASRNRQTGGSGLGLAIANNVARRHGGTLRFHQTATGFQASIAIPLGTV